MNTPGETARPDETTGPYATVSETHTSVLFFVADRVHKLKKPLDLGFLDHRERSARERACHREVELNRRLAPDVYLGVEDLLGPDGAPTDHLVAMRLLPASRRLSTLVRAGTDVTGIVTDIARRIAGLHARSPRSDAVDERGSADALDALWRDNLDHLDSLALGDDVARRSHEIRSLAAQFLAGRGPLFEWRVADGRAVDGHGDLMADDIFALPDGARIIDCLEFDDALRCGDAMMDVAFLVMDLDRLGDRRAARVLVDTYCAETGDPCPTALVHHFVAYRAVVRAKVWALRHLQGDEPARAAAIDRLDLALDHLARARPRLVLVGGASGSGKSTTARAVGALLDAPVLRSDVVRKEILAPGADPYTPDRLAATYRELVRRGAEELASGRSVVLDATWLDPAERHAAVAAAHRTQAEIVQVECVAEPAVLHERIARRSAAGDDPSDATGAVLDEQLRTRAPWPEAAPFDTGVTDPRDGLDEAWWCEVLGPLPWARQPLSLPGESLPGESVSRPSPAGPRRGRRDDGG
ncbi:AAA family ATPase [Rhodococcus rhodnii]|uniref:Gluconate kinase n=1 Tax=Rhodococcus rhodnii LMG 5362 TaxID=1273125 RepID=R7WP26_9NOCA|nr:AAA family ATPase [Rhodococcus rhodnii]EOM77071.1 hypothetical protein Rrhod_1538 [Rhodococcus rhodnii LMG 5362]